MRTIGIADSSLRSLANLAHPERASVGSLRGVLAALDSSGLRSVDIWGHMTFDHSLRHLGESPWERLRALANGLEHTQVRLLLRGRCLVGFRPYSASVVSRFVHEAAGCGVESFLVFDPLNDMDSLRYMAEVVRAEGAHLCLCLIHSRRSSDSGSDTETLHHMAALEPDAVCVRTVGSLGPTIAHEVVAAARQAVPMDLEVDFDNGSGLGLPASIAALEAGADVVHCSAAPQELYASGVPLAQLLAALADAGLQTESREQDLRGLCESLAGVLTPSSIRVEEQPSYARAASDFVSLAEVPGDLFRQVGFRLDERGALDRLPEVLSELNKVRSEIGSPELAPPLGQIVATQAILNVISGTRWQVVPDEMKALLRGEYGSLPEPFAPEFAQAVLADAGELEFDNDPPPFEHYEAALATLAESSGDVLLHALAPDFATRFLERRRSALDVDLSRSPSLLQPGEIEWDDQWHDLGPDRVRELVSLLEASEVEEVTVENKGTRVTVRKSSTGPGEVPLSSTREGDSEPLTPRSYVSRGLIADELEMQAEAEGRELIRASMVGTFYRSSSPDGQPFVNEGVHVDPGDTLCVLEAMKLMNEMVAEAPGTIIAVLVDDGTPVEYGQALFLFEGDA